MGRMIRRRLRSGAALITAIAFTMVVTMLVGGVATLAVQHRERGQIEADNSSALLLADAGINYELRYISDNQLNIPAAHQGYANRFTGSIAGVDGTFQCWVTNDPDDGNNWVPPKAMLLHAIGSIGGATGTLTRQVQARGVRQSLFDAWATFAYNALTMGGTNTFIVGDAGTNGTFTLNGGTPGVTSGFEMILAGPNAGGVSGSNVVTQPNPVNLPSIDPDIISKAPTIGFGTTNWTTIAGLRQNAQARKFASTSPALTPAGTQLAGSPWSDSASAFSMKIRNADFGAGYPSGPISTITDTDGTKRLVAAGTAGSTVETVAALILPSLSATVPTDYYFTDFQLASGGLIIIDNAGWTSGVRGVVRIWVGPSGGGSNVTDVINTNVYFTDPSPSQFRLYYAKCGTLTIGGNSYFYGGIYAVQKTCTGGPTINLNGGSKIFGSVLANYISLSGGSQVIFPANDSIDDPNDFSLWFGFRDQWHEIPAVGSNTFYDGTSK